MHRDQKYTELTPALASEWVDNELFKIVKNYKKDGRIQEVSFREWCSNWSWARRSDVYTHMIHSYPGKLLPYIPIFFIASSYLKDNDIILDPFAGTGTVLLESQVNRFKSINCWGVEINPLARLIAQVKTTPISIKRIDLLFQNILKYIQSNKKRIDIPEFHNRDFWFRGKAQIDLANIRFAIDKIEAFENEKDFFRVCFSSIIRDMSRADPDIAPPVRYNPHKFVKLTNIEIDKLKNTKLRANAYLLFKLTVEKNKIRLSELVEAIGLAGTPKSEIIWDDAKNIKRGKYKSSGIICKDNPKEIDNLVTMIITSPPYIAAQKYIRSTRLELSWLGIADDNEIRLIEKQTIGSERISFTVKKQQETIGTNIADRFIQKIMVRNAQRAAIAAKYYIDMNIALNNFYNTLKPKGICVIVVGDNTIAGQIAPNHRIFCEMAESQNKFRILSIIKDRIRSRGMITKRHETSGIINEEYIIILEKI